MARRIPITIQRLDEKEDWKDYAKTRATVNGIGGAEYWAAAAVQADTVKNFTVKFHPKLAKLIPQNCRIVYAGKIYDVKAIDDFEERHIELTFKAVAKYGR